MARVDVLNRPERVKIFELGRIIEEENLKFAKNICDLGIGTGAVTEQLLQIFPDAQFYGLDILQDMLDYVKDNRGTFNERLHLGLMIDPDKIPLQNASMDLVICITVYHEMHNHLALLNEIRRILTPNGKLLLIDWKKETPDREFGHAAEELYSETEILDNLNKSGFTNIKVLTTNKNTLSILATN
jgi:ubiquinone/menaquinone biosynthesis C-methylase UbiE